MAELFASRVRELLSTIKEHPNAFREPSITIDPILLDNMKRFLFQLVSGKKHAIKVVKNEVLDNGINDILVAVLFKLKSIGVTYEDQSRLVEDCIKYVLEFIAQNYPVHMVWTPVLTGVHTKKEVTELDEMLDLTSVRFHSPFAEVKYSVENALLLKSTEGWKLTPLGNLFISLSVPSSIALLLMIENYLSTPGKVDPFVANRWHMNRDFIESLLKNSIYVDIGEPEYSLLEYDPNMDYLNRIEEFGLTYTLDRTEERRSSEANEFPIIHIGDDFFETNLTEFGREVLSQVLITNNNILKEVMISLIKFDIAGVKFGDFGQKDVLLELQTKINSTVEVIGTEKELLDEIISELQLGVIKKTSLRGLLPSIEKILKNILVSAGELPPADTIATLGKIVQIFRSVLTKRLILTEATINYIDSLDRNKILHGNITPKDEILKAYVNLSLNVLTIILDDYVTYKAKK